MTRPAPNLVRCHHGPRGRAIAALCRWLPLPLGWRMERALGWWLDALGVAERPYPAPAAAIGEDHVLHLKLALPVAALGALDAHIAGLVTRRTPFAADQVAGGYLLTPGADGGQVQCDILLATPGRLPETDIGLRLAGESLTLDLPPARRLGMAAQRRLVLALALVAAIAAALLAPIAQLRAQRDQQALALAASEQAALQARALADQLALLRQTRAQAGRFRAAQPRINDILGALSTALAGNAWLDDLVLDGDAITIRGRAPSAADVLQALDQSAQLDAPRLAAPISVDPQGLEVFTIAMTVGARHAPD